MKLFLVKSETYGQGLLIFKCQIIRCRIKGLVLYAILLWQCDVHTRMKVLLLLYRFSCSSSCFMFDWYVYRRNQPTCCQLWFLTCWALCSWLWLCLLAASCCSSTASCLVLSSFWLAYCLSVRNAHACTHTHTHTCTYIYKYTHTHVHTYINTHIYTHTHTHTHARTHTHTYVCIYI